MDDLILTDEQARLLERVRRPIEVRDSTGRVLGIFAPRPAAASAEPLSQCRSAYDLAQQLGSVGSVVDAPSDLSTNPRHLEGLGRD